MTFVLGNSSLAQLKGVHPALVACVKRAITTTDQDFTVQEGVRSAAQQAIDVRKGVSTTLDSQHLLQADGFAHAVDLVPFDHGAPNWDWGEIFHIAAAMREASVALSTPIRWGGVWDRLLTDHGPGWQAARDAEADYVRRRQLQGQRRVFVDGPHFELRLQVGRVA